MARLILPYQQVFDLNGDPLAGAKMYFYESGTVTPKDTYSDEALTTPNTNPVIADSQGQFGDIFLSGAYSCKLTDSSDVTQPDYPAEIAATADTAASVLLTGDQTIAGVKTFTDRTANKANTPTYELEENDGAANNRIWQIVSAAEQFIIRLANDARDSFASFITATRTANVIDNVTINSGDTMTITSTNELDLVTADLKLNGTTLVSAILSTKILPIGAWDMDTSNSVNIAHGITEYRDIRSVSAYIRSDDSVSWVQAPWFTAAGQIEYWIQDTNATNIQLIRRTGGFFDSASYDLTQYNLDVAAAVDKGGGLVGIPITAHTFIDDDITTLAGTINYDGTYTIVSQTANEIVITATYVAESFAGTETASWSRGWVTINYQP